MILPDILCHEEPRQKDMVAMLSCFFGIVTVSTVNFLDVVVPPEKPHRHDDEQDGYQTQVDTRPKRSVAPNEIG
jgi:hypothetical protein